MDQDQSAPPMTKGARQALAAERARQAFELRKAGATYEDIGRVLGITRQSAHAMIRRKLRDLAKVTEESAVELFALEWARLDAMHKGLWTKATAGSVLAVDRVLRIMERRARMTGSDKPIKVAETDPEGGPLRKDHEDAVIAGLLTKRLPAPPDS